MDLKASNASELSKNAPRMTWWSAGSEMVNSFSSASNLVYSTSGSLNDSLVTAPYFTTGIVTRSPSTVISPP